MGAEVADADAVTVGVGVDVVDGVGVCDGEGATGDNTMPRYSAERPGPYDTAETMGAELHHVSVAALSAYTPALAVTYAVEPSAESDTRRTR